MTATCPNGHATASTDYCDTCGAPMTAAAPDSGGKPTLTVVPDPDPEPKGPAGKPCPNCSDEAPADALFCESCGYDFTTGTMPRPDSSLDLAPTPAPDTTPEPPKAPIEWVVERWVDPDWYTAQQADDPCPSPGLPVVVPLTAKSMLVGRPSKSRAIHPDVDCGDDTGVSRRQAQLTTDGQRWWVEDLQSSNGTYVGPASGPLPTTPVPPGQRKELGEDDRVYVGAWTRLVVRRATDAEKAGQA